MKENVCVSKSFEFTVRIVNLYKFLTAEHKEYTLSKQLLRAGTSIGANVAEAQRGQSKADFLAKMSIALKEANETQYWLKLLRRTEYLNDAQFESINNDVDELLSIFDDNLQKRGYLTIQHSALCIQHFGEVIICT